MSKNINRKASLQILNDFRDQCQKNDACLNCPLSLNHPVLFTSSPSEPYTDNFFEPSACLLTLYQRAVEKIILSEDQD